MAVYLNPVTNWTCQHCDLRAVTRNGETNRLHTCPGLAHITAPMVPEGVQCDVRVHEREDYVGGAIAHLDSTGRAIMSVETVREDGNDVRVFADCATTRTEANSTGR